MVLELIPREPGHWIWDIQLLPEGIIFQVVEWLSVKLKKAFKHLAGIYIWESEYDKSVNGKFLFIFLELVIALPLVCVIVESCKSGWNWVSGCRAVGWIIFTESKQILFHKWQQIEIIPDWQLVLIWKKQQKPKTNYAIRITANQVCQVLSVQASVSAYHSQCFGWHFNTK